LINAKVLKYISQPDFEQLYALIRRTEQALNGYMAYVRRLRAGSQEYGDKSVHEDPGDYEIDEQGNRETGKQVDR